MLALWARGGQSSSALPPSCALGLNHIPQERNIPNIQEDRGAVPRAPNLSKFTMGERTSPLLDVAPLITLRYV